MVGDWIPMEVSTPRKPQVMAIARELGIIAQHAAGSLMAVWAWVDQQYESEHLDDATDADIDAVGGMSGLAAAMRNVGWLTDSRTGGLLLPGLERHMLGPTSKARSQQRAARAIGSNRQAQRATECGTARKPRANRAHDPAVSAPESIPEHAECDAVSTARNDQRGHELQSECGTSGAQRAPPAHTYIHREGHMDVCRPDDARWKALVQLRRLPRWSRDQAAETFAWEALDQLHRLGADPVTLAAQTILRAQESHRGVGWIVSTLRRKAGLLGHTPSSPPHAP